MMENFVTVTDHHSVADSSSTSGQLARLTEEVVFLREKSRKLQRELDEVDVYVVCNFLGRGWRMVLLLGIF